MATQNQHQDQGSLQGQQQNQQQETVNRTQSGQPQAVPHQLGQKDDRKEAPRSPQDQRGQIGDKPPQNEQGDPRQLQLENDSIRQQGSDSSGSQEKSTPRGGVTSDRRDSPKGSSSDQL